MTAAMDQLSIVSLGGSNVSQPGTAADNVHNDDRKFRAGDVRETFLHQADARAGAGGHGAQACAGCAVDHVDRAQFAFSLHESTPQFGHARAEMLEQLGLGSDGVAKVRDQTSPHRCFSNSNISFDHFKCHYATSPSFLVPGRTPR